MTDVTYFFDPACPWTWYTTRWLRTVEDTQKLNIQWRPFSLLVLNDYKPPAQYAAALQASHSSLRLIEALRADDKQADIIRFYEWLGEQNHDNGVDFTAELVSAGVEACGLTDYSAALGDEGLDAAVNESTKLAIDAAGPDIGSPVIAFAGIERGFHGPVIAHAVEDEALADKIWTVVSTAVQMPEFLEIKRGRG